MKYLLYMVIVAVALSIPLERQDVAKLKPVELVSVYTEGDQVVLATDTKDIGVGKTLSQAYENLELTTPGVIYLDTAQYLLISDEALPWVPELRGYLKENVALCLQEGVLDPEMAVKYLSEQANLPKLKTWEEGVNMPILQEYNKRLIFLEKSEKSS